jgi:drug/metabolite transporter (DMT)-like permease
VPPSRSSEWKSRKAYAAWVVICLVWGTTYLAIRIALETVPPLLMPACRWIAAGSLLIGILKARGERLPAASSWATLAIVGTLLVGVGNGAVVWAEQTVPSGLTAVLVAASPFWMVGIESFMPGGEHLTRRRAFGLLMGFSGILVLVWPDLRAGAQQRGVVVGALMTQLACLGWAIGSTYARRHGREGNVLAGAALEMLFGGLVLLVAGTVAGEWSKMALTPRSAGALVYLALVGSVAGFSAYLYALKHLPVATVSLYAYANPIIAVVLGAVVLGEPVTGRLAVASAIVLASMTLVRTKAG